MIKKTIKSVVKKTIPKRILHSLRTWRKNIGRLQRYNRNYSLMDAILKSKNIIGPYRNMSATHEFARQFKYMSQILNWSTPYTYLYTFDPTIIRGIDFETSVLASITVDFSKVLDFNIENVRSELMKCTDEEFRECEISILNSLNILVNRIKSMPTTSVRQEWISNYCSKMLASSPSTLDEALQKILFFDGLFWQAGHNHIGLGRLDLILCPHYDSDINAGILTRDKAKELIKNFCLTLGCQTNAKSCSLIGDTGQYILLGGIDKSRKNVANPLTEIFLEIFAENHFPDPKLILRANSDTPDIIWTKAIKSIATGNGSPLIMNETAVMDGMVQFGYSPDDVWNVGTSACWEPLIIGKSFDQNNSLPSINLVEPLSEIIISDDCPDNFDELFAKYKQKIAEKIRLIAKDIKFDCFPLFSIFFEDCISRGCDFSDGGTIYSYHGMQVVGLPNLVNSLLNLKLKVFGQSIININQLKSAIINDYVENDDVREILLAGSCKFGKDDPKVISLTNEVMGFVDDIISTVRINGHKVKIGFSSPNYISTGISSLASPDGRRRGEPLAVHISPTSSDIDLSEVMDFAASLDYGGNRLNGNVVDFIVPTSYIKFPEKLTSILRNSIKNGVYELQLNVLDKHTLIDAKLHPEKYPNLIVRVWGFSAYFNDLPDEYKDNLINRACIYEAS